MTKAELRKKIRAQLLQITPDEHAEKSRRICEAIAREPAWQAARTVCLFAAQATEPDIELLWDSGAGKKICYPRVNESRLDLIAVSERATLAESRWKLREPPHAPEHLVALEKIDLLLVPGIAFSRDGGRLGRGGGFYDRLIADARLRARKIGVCFDVQLLPGLPREAHDKEVDEIVTESGRAG